MHREAPMRSLFASLLLTALALAPAPPASPRHRVFAVDEFQALQSRLQASHTAHHWPANLAAAQAQQAFLHDDPDSLLEVARAAVHLHNFSLAFAELQEFVRMGQSTGFVDQTPDFADLRSQPHYPLIQRGMMANRTPVARATPVFLLSDPTLLAEDIDYDPAGHRFLVTSVRRHKIVSVDARGAAVDFAQAPDPWPVVAIKIDSARNRVWATEAAMQSLVFSPQPDWGSTAILAWDLRTGRLLRRVAGPHGGSFGDMLLLPSGDVIVSDGDGGGVYRLPANGVSLQRLDRGDFISPQTPALLPDGHRMVVPDYVRGLAVLDLATRQVRWFSPQGRYALNGIDGLYFDRGRLLAIQNGTTPERVVVFTLDASLARVVSATIVERSTSTLGDPTHGVLVGENFYYIANSGWDILDDHGNIKSGASQTPARIMRVSTVTLAPPA
jgi:sugar lactone lactonase YvrE